MRKAYEYTYIHACKLLSSMYISVRVLVSICVHLNFIRRAINIKNMPCGKKDSTKENKVRRTGDQEDALLKLIEKHRSVVIDKFQSDAGCKLKAKIWEQIAEQVNRFDGPKKNGDQWKRVKNT